MGEIKALQLNDKDSNRIIQEQKEELEYLKSFIGNVSIESIKQKDIKITEQERIITEKDKKILVLENSIKEKSSTIELLQKNRKDDIEKAVNQERARLTSLKNTEAENKVKNAKANTANKIRKEELEPIKAKYEALLEHIGETTDRIDINVLQILEIITNAFDNVSKEIDNCTTKEEIKNVLEKTKQEIIEETHDKTNCKPTEEDKKKICNRIRQLELQGLNNKQIAQKLIDEKFIWFDTLTPKSAENKVGRYKDNKYYTNLLK